MSQTGISNEECKYRPEIDGLRAVAVIAVVLFHARLFNFTGGYVGVDIFFVISGFLISSIIIRDFEKKTFSLAVFWERRIRRILPALFVTLLGTVCASYFIILYPSDFKDIGLSLVYQAFFLSNMLFLRRNNYFESGAADNNPFLHTWSLSVEEQFYVIFPLIMFFGVKFFHTQLKKIIFNLGAISLLLCIWMVNFAPDGEVITFFSFIPNTVFNHALNNSSAFYLIFTRAWELASGVLLALSTQGIKSKKVAEVVGLLGATAIFISIFTFSESTPFPGIAALLPVIGTVAVIAGTTHHVTVCKRILSQAHLVKIGLISYSLYLWHWPVLVLGKTFAVRELKVLEIIGLIILSFLLAFVSYRYVETPFRSKKILKSGRQVIVFAVSGFLVVVGIGLFVRLSDGMMERLTSQEKELFNSTLPLNEYKRNCLSFSLSDFEGKSLCKMGSSDNVEFVLWGDSFAASSMPLFEKITQEKNYSGVLIGGAGCPPVPGTYQTPRSSSCEQINDFALTYIRENDIKTVVFVARWGLYVLGGPSGDLEVLIGESENPSQTVEEAVRVFEKSFSSLISELISEDRQVIVFLQIPEKWNYDVRKDFYKVVFKRESFIPQTGTAKEYIDYQNRINQMLLSIAKEYTATVIDPTTVLCSNDGVCNYEIDGVQLYSDRTHLSDSGALLLEPLLQDIELGEK